MAKNTEFKHWPNLVDMFFDQAAKFGDKPFLWAKRDGAWQSLSWRDVEQQVRALASALHNMGIEEGDRVVLVSENRPEFAIADLAILAAGGVVVPTYTTNTIDDHMHILENSQAKGAIISTRALSQRFLPAAHRAVDMDFVISMEPLELKQNLSIDVHEWDDILICEEGGGQVAEDLIRRSRAKGRRDLACLIYTSGTGGAPKGVMQPHGAILHNCEGAHEVLYDFGLDDEVFLSFLPLSHAYEHSAGLYFPMTLGAQIYYAEGVDKLLNNLAECRPSIMTVVPRLFEMIRGRVKAQIDSQGGLTAKLFEKTIELGTKQYETGKLNPWEHVQNAVLTLLVKRKIQKRFGGRIKALVSGGAPLNPEVGMFFHSLGLRLLQGYGQTESGPVSNVNRPGKIKMHTVGPALKNTEIKIAGDGEICLRGELVMLGYWRDNEATAKAIDGEGWLHTGDIGVLDEDGYLQITDRKKDIIVFDKGDNVSPQRIEGMLALEPEIAQAMVYGDKRPYLVGLLVPDDLWLAEWAKEHGKDGGNLESLYDDPDLHKALDEAVSRVNKRMSQLERVRRVITAHEAFSVDNKLMTPSLKIRRHAIKEIYGEQLDGLYG